MLIDGLTEWMKRKGFSGVDDVRGLLAVPPAPTAPPSSGRAT